MAEAAWTSSWALTSPISGPWGEVGAYGFKEQPGDPAYGIERPALLTVHTRPSPVAPRSDPWAAG